MNLKSVLANVSHVAPTLAKVISLIPGGQIPGALLGLLGEAFGGTDETTIANNIQTDPNVVIKLKQIDSDERLATLANQLQSDQGAYAAQQATQAWVKTFEYFIGGCLIGTGGFFMFVVIATIVTNVQISPDEKWLLTTIAAPSATLFSGLISAFIQLMKRK